MLAPPGARARRARLRLARRAAGGGARRPPERVSAGVRVERRGARAGADVVLASPLERARPRHSSRRRAPSSSTSPARTGSRTRALSGVVRLRAPAGGGARRLELRAARARPPTGSLIANPGCYATAALLALAPLADAIDPASVVVDAKSGVSGAGRQLKESSHAGFVLENVSPYKIGSHQHAPEIAQALGFPVCFVPHLLPIRRGLLATCYVDLDDGRPARAAARGRVCRQRRRPGAAGGRRARARARPAHRRGRDRRSSTDRSTGRTIVICALDNLGKGAAGQAVQNANLALGLDETLGLRLTGVLV